MGYDVYGEFWKSQDHQVKKWINQKWEETKNNKNITWNKKPKKMKNSLERDVKSFNKFVSVFTGNKNKSLGSYNNAKFQEIEEAFTKEQGSYLKKYIHTILMENIKNYSCHGDVDNLDLTKNPKKAYINVFNFKEDGYFEFSQDIKKRMKFFEPDNTPEIFPEISSLLKVDFKLKKAYISKDDEEFYIGDNPICKDKVFKVPEVRPSSWKGALRYASMKSILDKNGEEKVDSRINSLRLFGNEKTKMKQFLDEQFGNNLKNKYEKKLEELYGDENPNLRGRLTFYPTFFYRISLDVITPHDRENKAPTDSMGPLNFETVPPRTKGTLSLCYFPFDLIGKENIDKEINEDLNFLKDSIIDMFTKYGFGAKTTSGYGTATIINIKINGKDCGKDFNKAFEGMKR